MWAPVFMFEEIVELIDKDILPSLLFSHPGQKTSRASRINLTKSGDLFICPCFDEPANKCRIYPRRPFDCALYPFLLVRKDELVYLAIDKKCPYAASNSGTFKTALYKGYLKRSLQSKQFIVLAKNNPEIAGDYGSDPDIMVLSALPALSRALNGTSAPYNKR